ncbi:MAG: exosome complex protein Rrp42 [Candidatus Micrarchaeia archaeon]
MDIISNLMGGYIKDTLEKGGRLDSRGPYSFREINVETGIISHAEGSAQVDIGATKVLAGVKLMVEDPMPDTPGQGNLMMNAELLPLAYADYETGPPSPESVELARVVDRGIRAGNSIDLLDLALEDGKVWSVFVDLYVLNYGGNLFDASGLAAMAALANTKMPKYENGAVIREERSKKLKIDNIVTYTTFGKVSDHLLLDMNINEEDIASARLTIATDDDQIRAMQKGMNGSFTGKEIEELIDISFEKHKDLKNIMEKSIE